MIEQKPWEERAEASKRNAKSPQMGQCYLCGAKTRSHFIADEPICHKCWTKMNDQDKKALEQKIKVSISTREHKKMETMEMVKSMRRPVKENKTLIEKTLEEG